MSKFTAGKVPISFTLRTTSAEQSSVPVRVDLLKICSSSNAEAELGL
jgi:hypothetical protein